MTRVVTAGETMALLDPEREGELELDDRLGSLIREALRAEGVDLRWVQVSRGEPTGLFYKWRAEGRTSVAYHRRGSAASRMRPADVPDEALEGASLVHLTGITMALGEGPRELVVDLARRARRAGAIVTFDPNFRPALWESPAAAAAAMEPVLEHVDWCLCGAEEAALLGTAARLVVRTARGAVVDGIEVPPPRREAVVDEVGAGDAFAAGFAYGLLRGRSPRAAVVAAHAVAAWALRGTGDWETLPRLRDVFPDD